MRTVAIAAGFVLAITNVGLSQVRYELVNRVGNADVAQGPVAVPAGADFTIATSANTVSINIWTLNPATDDYGRITITGPDTRTTRVQFGTGGWLGNQLMAFGVGRHLAGITSDRSNIQLNMRIQGDLTGPVQGFDVFHVGVDGAVQGGIVIDDNSVSGRVTVGEIAASGSVVSTSRGLLSLDVGGSGLNTFGTGNLDGLVRVVNGNIADTAIRGDLNGLLEVIGDGQSAATAGSITSSLVVGTQTSPGDLNGTIRVSTVASPTVFPFATDITVFGAVNDDPATPYSIELDQCVLTGTMSLAGPVSDDIFVNSIIGQLVFAKDFDSTLRLVTITDKFGGTPGIRLEKALLPNGRIEVTGISATSVINDGCFDGVVLLNASGTATDGWQGTIAVGEDISQPGTFALEFTQADYNEPRASFTGACGTGFVTDGDGIIATVPFSTYDADSSPVGQTVVPAFAAGLPITVQHYGEVTTSGVGATPEVVFERQLATQDPDTDPWAAVPASEWAASLDPAKPRAVIVTPSVDLLAGWRYRVRPDITTVGTGALVNTNVVGGVADDRSYWFEIELINTCTADIDGDGDVDLDDFSIFIAQFGLTTQPGDPPLSADFDGNGVVDLDDFSIFAAQFERTDCLTPPSAMMARNGSGSPMAFGPSGHPMDEIARHIGFRGYEELEHFLYVIRPADQAIMMEVIDRVIRGEMPR